MAMKKQLLLTLLLTVAVTANMKAQEQTAMPGIIEGGDSFIRHDKSWYEDYSQTLVEIYNCVTFENNDEADATIYYRRNSETDWMEYFGESFMGGNFTVEAYAVAPGKLPSEIVSANVYYNTYYLYAACIVDGIHYYIEQYQYEPDGEPHTYSDVSVCSRKESYLYSPPYTGDIVVPSEIVWDKTYTVTGIRKAAFAASFDYSSDIVSVELPNTISEINSSAFAGCTQMKRMTIHAVTPPSAYNLFNYEYGDEDYGYYNYIGFDGSRLYDLVTLFVPYEALDAYRAHQEWGKFSRIVPFLGAGPGDVNGDGKLSISDVTDIINQLLNDGDIPAYCDVNGDGKVSIGDITALIDKLLKAE